MSNFNRVWSRICKIHKIFRIKVLRTLGIFSLSRSPARDRPSPYGYKRRFVLPFVNRLHDAQRLRHRRKHLPILTNSRMRQRLTAPVAQPLLADLISTYLKLPHRQRHIREILRRINPDMAIAVLHARDNAIAFTFKSGSRVRQFMSTEVRVNFCSLSSPELKRPALAPTEMRVD